MNGFSTPNAPALTAHGVRLEEETQCLFAEQRDDLSDDVRETRYGLQAAEGGPVGGVLP
jgi:hypothetical protein